MNTVNVSASLTVKNLEDYQIHCVDRDYHMEFTVYKIVGRGLNSESGEYNVPLFGENAIEETTGIEPFWTGSIKWDGCSNWDFRTDKCMAHFCGRSQALSIGVLMEELYNLAATMKHWDAEVAK